MLSSKRTSLIRMSALLISFGLMLSACIKADRKSDEDLEQSGQNAQASFYVTSMPNPEPQPPTYDRIWNLPTAANYKFKACVIQRVTRDKIIGRRFTVIEGERTHTVISDGEGCIEWSESVPFNFFAERPYYLVFERTIRGSGVDRGEQTISFALDPWKSSRGGSHAEFIFLRRQDLVEEEVALRGEQEIFQAQTRSVEHNLIIDGLTLDIQQRRQLSNGVELSMAMEMDPHVRLRRMDGTDNNYDLNHGRFTVYAQIIATNLGSDQNQNYRITPYLRAEGVGMQDGQLRVTFPNFPLEIFNPDGNLALAVKVVPDGQQGSLRDYTAIYRLGAFNQWLGTRRPLRQAEDSLDLGMDYNELLESLRQSEQATDTSERDEFFGETGLVRLDPFRFGYFTIKYNGIKAGETATTRTVAFDVKTCVTHTLHGGIPARHKRFLVTVRPGTEPIEKVTDEHGCMAWIDEVTHKYYKPEHYMVSPVVLQDVTSGFRKELRIAINPWDLFATFGKDLREVEANDLRFQYANLERPPQQIESRFNLADFSYTAIRFDYGIQQDLSLNVKKSVLLRLFPEVQRYSSITGGRLAVERLRDGIWLLKVAIQKDYLDPATKEAVIDNDGGRPVYRLNQYRDIREKQYISYQEKLVRVINGRIITPVEMEMRDLRLMRIRSNMLIQLEPIDETLLQGANIYREYLDRVAEINERLGGTLEALECDRAMTAPMPEEDRQDSVNNEVIEQNCGEGAENVDQMTVEERERYYYQRMAEINRFITRLDSSQLRDAISRGDIDRLNAMIHDASRFDENGFPFSEELTQGIPYDFQHTYNREIDAGLLNAMNNQFNLTEEFLNRFRLNDFTVEPAAPIASLRFLIETPEESGLRKRTFVGPVTFLLNSNQSWVRPTDTLDEVFCLNNTCDSQAVTEEQLREWSWGDDTPYEWRRFYGWVAHFFNKHVDDLIFIKRGGERTYVNSSGQTVTESAIGLDELYDREMKARSLLSNFVNLNDLTFVSLRNEPLQTVREDCEMPFYDEACLQNVSENTMTREGFLEQLNQIGQVPEFRVDERGGYQHNPLYNGGYDLLAVHLANHPTTAEDVFNFVQNERVEGWLGHKICHLMIDKLLTRLLELNFLTDYSVSEVRAQYIYSCTRDVRERGVLDWDNPLLTVHPKYRIYETGRKRFKGGKSMNINVAQNFSLSNKESAGFKRSYDFLGLPRLIPAIGDMLAGAGLQMGWDSSRDRSAGTTITSATFLVVQMATFDIELLSYEKCIVLGYKHDALARMLGRRLYSTPERADATRVAVALNSGFLICSGHIENEEPLPVRERYYYVTQHFTEGDMLDSGDLYNHPWLLAIRGARDFKTFMMHIHRNDDAESVDAWDIMGDYASGEGDSQSRIQKYTWPIDQLVETYLHVLPTFPGIYTPLRTEPRDFPWDDSPGDSFAETGAGLGGNFRTEVPVSIPEELLDTVGASADAPAGQEQSR